MIRSALILINHDNLRAKASALMSFQNLKAHPAFSLTHDSCLTNLTKSL